MTSRPSDLRLPTEPSPQTPHPPEVRATEAHVTVDATLAGWAYLLRPPRAEARRTQRRAHLGGLLALASLVAYLGWRILFTLPAGGADLVAAWLLVGFEGVAVLGLTVRVVTLWNIDARAPRRVTEVEDGLRAVVMIPTYNEPVEVIAPTIAAACDLQPVHQTWVLDDGDRAWVRELCEAYGARYVSRETHEHAKAGNMNNALALLRAEQEAGADPLDVIAVLDCDHVPLPTFLTDTLGWFDDPELALVQGPQSYYNSGAFDDDGITGEQGMFFHVLLAGRNRDSAGPFWCGSTSLIRTSAIVEVGGISTETIVEDMHTTLNLIRHGWKTVYHHQTLAVGLAPATAEQYLLQRRRWGMGSMQVLVTERLWRAKRWLSWRNFYEYLGGTVYWLEGVGTVLLFVVPAAVLLSGAEVSTAPPWLFALVFVSAIAIRMWGTKQLFRGHLHWRSAFALRMFRIPIGLSCAWWLLTRRTLTFEVTPKAGDEERVRGRAPVVLHVLTAVVLGVLAYAAAGALGLVPWRSTPAATVASSAWLTIAAVVLVLGTRRIADPDFASSRRNAHRVAVHADVVMAGAHGTLMDISMGGAAVRFASGQAPATELVELRLPGVDPVTLQVVRVRQDGPHDVVSCRVRADDWQAYRVLAQWLFHTPPGVVQGIPAGVPAVAATQWRRQPKAVSSFGAPEFALPAGSGPVDSSERSA
jgi:cellulose synthase (UDP-forming)